MTDWHIHTGDCIEVLRAMPAESVHVCVTSPPYFGLRDYGIDGQIGLEQSPAEFVRKMVEVFEEVKRVMRHDATLWMNMGDGYANAGQTGNDRRGTLTNGGKPRYTPIAGLKPKDLMLMPARVALALQEAGWWVRSDIIWCKRAPMPESVTDRPTSAHEHVFLLSKSERYFYDADAVRVASAPASIERVKSGWAGNEDRGYVNGPQNHFSKWLGSERAMEQAEAGRNLWNYWLLSPEPYTEAHFATFPTEIPRRAILAGTSEHGVCGECGAPWKRVVERTPVEHPGSYNGSTFTNGKTAAPHDNVGQGMRYERTGAQEWQPTCRHTSAPVVPATVLDPFSGAGTTVMQALRLGRRGIGIELNPQYVEMSKRRIMADAPLFNTPMEAIA